MTRLILLSILALLPAIHAQDRPLPPKDAPKAMKTPDGFQATLFAGEPDVVQPIAMTFDDRGRLWVVECRSYPKWIEKGEGADSVVMFEDTDGDGTFDKRQVVLDRGTNLSGIELGFGGIWLCSIPNLLFVPCDFNADAPKIGKPEVVLDGWSLKCKHNVVNSLTWGPDGWLYGCNGIIDTSYVGTPGTDKKDRVAINCGVWRFHPTKKVFEAFAHGTTNPFGLDFDDYGELFITNCVIHHLWHVIPGAHFERMYGEDFNKHVYGLMQSPADHIHWGGGNWTTSRGGKGVHSEAGGGHAHVGCMVYLGDNWPDTFRNGVFMLNLHGNRVNHDRLERKGSGYVARHEPDFLFANDPWFRGIAIKYGPDGGVFMSDWCDTGECHNYDKADITNGRIYKVTFGKTNAWKGDISKLSDAELVKLQSHKNDWHVRHARRVMQERAADKKLTSDAIADLNRMLKESKSTQLRLRAMWAIHSIDAIKARRFLTMVSDEDVAVCAWAYRLFFDVFDGDEDMQLFEMIDHPRLESPRVQQAIASGLQRPKSWRESVATMLLQSVKNADDRNLILMVWYALEPKVAEHPSFGITCLGATSLPFVRQSIARRLSSTSRPGNIDMLVGWLTESFHPGAKRSPEQINDVLQGMLAGLAGQRQTAEPKCWQECYALLAKSDSPQVRERAAKLAVQFGDARAIEALRKVLANSSAEIGKRESALQALMMIRKPDLVPLLQDLLLDKPMRAAALRSLAAFNEPDTPQWILKHYAQFNGAEKADAVQTLASRAAWAVKLLDAIEKKQLPRSDVSVFVARQIQGLKDKQVQEKLANVWGKIQPASKEKAEQIARWKKKLTPEHLKSADLSRGRFVYAKNCAACHRLYDDGGDIGPALTGSQRANLDYILENVLDPSAVVAREYQMVKIDTQSGRTINGIIKQETDKALTIQTPNELIVLPKDEIENRTQSQLSMMPEGLFDKLTAEEIRDLVAYLASKNQAPLPKDR